MKNSAFAFRETDKIRISKKKIEIALFYMDVLALTNKRIFNGAHTILV